MEEESNMAKNGLHWIPKLLIYLLLFGIIASFLGPIIGVGAGIITYIILKPVEKL